MCKFRSSFCINFLNSEVLGLYIYDVHAEGGVELLKFVTYLPISFQLLKKYEKNISAASYANTTFFIWNIYFNRNICAMYMLTKICVLFLFWSSDALRDLVSFIQLKNVKNTHEGVLLSVKLQAKARNYTKCNTPPWVSYVF